MQTLNNLRLRIELGKKGEASKGEAFDGLSLVEEPGEGDEEEEFGVPNIDHTSRRGKSTNND